MAWQDMAKTMQMLASLGDAMKLGSKGPGKGGKASEGKGGDRTSPKQKWCQWDT